MEPYMPRIRAYYRTLQSNWRALLIVASLASIVYTINVYSQYSPQGAQQDEYIKGGEPSTILPGPNDRINTLILKASRRPCYWCYTTTRETGAGCTN